MSQRGFKPWAVGLAAATLLAPPMMLDAQAQPPMRNRTFQNGEPVQRGWPCGDAPKILIGTFASRDSSGIKFADELRNRVREEHNAKELCVVPRAEIVQTLEQSGYRGDSALNTNDLVELAKQRSANQIIGGETVKLGRDSVRVTPKLFVRSGQTSITQPLPVLNAKDVGEAAKQTENNISEAQKQLAGYTTCHNAYLANKFADAVVGAKLGIQTYPRSTVARFCLLQAQNALKLPPDTLIATATAILELDSMNTGALAYLSDSYMAKGDTAKAMDTNMRLYRADPTNSALAQTIVRLLASSGQPEKALPIVDELLKDNPGDAEMLKTRWVLLINAKRYKDAYAAGDELIKTDTSAANEGFFTRMAAVAGVDSNTAKQTEYLARGAQKFTKSADLQAAYANALYKAGQLQQALLPAQLAVAADPKSVTGYQLLLIIQAQLGMTDSAFSTAKKALAAGVDKKTIGDALLAVAGPSLKKAQETKDVEDWKTLFALSSRIDSIVPSNPGAKFFLTYSAFSIALDAMQPLNTLAQSTKAADKAKACEIAKNLNDLFTIVQINAPMGGAYSPEAKAGVGQIMANMMGVKPGEGLADIPANVKKALNCKGF